MGEHRGGPRGELRHGALVAATVLLVLGLVAAWSVLIPGFMDWDDIVAAVIGSLRLTGPLGAAFAAWVAMRRRQAERGRVLTPWRAAKAPLSIIAVVTGSFGATVLLLGLRAALTGQGGPLLPGGLAMSVAGLGLYVVVGWILGWLVPVVVVPLIAGAGTYGLFTWLADGPTWAFRLAPAPGEPFELLSGMRETAYADQTLWLLGLGTTLFLGWVALVTRRTLALVAAVIAVLAAGTGAARLVTEPQTMAASERLAFTCQEWPITVCVRPAFRAGLAELATVFTALALRLAGTPAAFTRVEQRAYGEEEPVRPGVVVVHFDDLTSGYAQRAAAEFLDRLARPCPGTVAAGYRGIVLAWLRGVSPLPIGPLPEHHDASIWFSELTEPQRQDWLRMFYYDFVSCGLQAKHFGGGARATGPARGNPASPVPAFVPGYKTDPAYPGAAVATAPAGGWEPSPAPGWTGPSPSAPAWPSPAVSPAYGDPPGEGPAGHGHRGWRHPGWWDMPPREGARRGRPWGPGRPPHHWRPGRSGDARFPGHAGDASPSPAPDRPQPGASPSGAPGAERGTAPGSPAENAPDHGRPAGRGGADARPGGTGGPEGPRGGDGRGHAGRDGAGRRAGRPARPGVPATGRAAVPGSASGRGPGRDGHDGRNGRDSDHDAGRTNRTEPGADDAGGPRDAIPQDDPGPAGVPGALLAPAA